MNKSIHKQVFKFLVCALLVPQFLFGYTNIIDDIKLEVSNLADNPREALVSTVNPITSSTKSITVDQFLKKGITPVKVTISNNSKNSIIISPESVLKESLTADEAAGMFHIDHIITQHLLAEACIAGIFSPIPVLSGFAYWYGAKHYITTTNEQLTVAFNQAFAEQDKKGKCIKLDKKGNCVIKPGSSVTKVVLLKEEDELSQFTFQVFDEQKAIISSFEVALEN